MDHVHGHHHQPRHAEEVEARPEHDHVGPMLGNPLGAGGAVALDAKVGDAQKNGRLHVLGRLLAEAVQQRNEVGVGKERGEEGGPADPPMDVHVLPPDGLRELDAKAGGDREGDGHVHLDGAALLDGAEVRVGGEDVPPVLDPVRVEGEGRRGDVLHHVVERPRVVRHGGLGGPQDRQDRAGGGCVRPESHLVCMYSCLAAWYWYAVYASCARKMWILTAPWSLVPLRKMTEARFCCFLLVRGDVSDVSCPSIVESPRRRDPLDRKPASLSK